ncbi:similar to Saccharomyces cerevisiae YOR276W CAF20 Phosphoprotein of the mRNA cap-binding complex involved in translational control [Maudiozyma barnettii]|uniref:Cap-associated protein CAF20 n=1 Tax=Maudiozyma barnettii TaxID=61262 RepID=A0A8H2ZIB2_9SACH|nr:Caf20p [Kazachstania barnettii]CAB4252909.1 similar to Saccharomyces cerevisiae YOR276W CAF20 Phosphoprotein of the mRNA cap-binding complex involved in translational control [Kazachstania barnettii]CAD1780704.1 similar to Saccharomyces cerevisiae YOR276W CAF20 Phosphoprotein of the mRNA cap-binding complex involved in translational control [Kazachstania barnettii]
MPSYTIEELIQLKPSETLSVNFDAVEFNAIIEKVKQVQALKEEEYNATHHGHFNRRRSSHLHHGKPKVKQHKPKVTTDENGWSTFEPKTNEEGDSENNSDSATTPFTPTISKETVKVKPNNRHISSSRPADNSDIITDKQVHGFNTFAALVSDDEDDE